MIHIAATRRCAIFAATVLAGTAQLASADERRHQSMVVTAPTAFIEGGAIQANARIDQRGDWAMGASLILGGIASVGISSDYNLRACIQCIANNKIQPIRATSATFRMGARADQWFHGQPALALGVRVMMSSDSLGTSAEPKAIRSADIYAVASRDIATFTVHGGVIGQDAETVETISDVRIVHRLVSSRWPQIRPIAALQWHPSIYPRTTLMADLSWLVEWRGNSNPSGEKLTQTWIAGWGVQFRAYRRTTLDLTVRHRQDEGLPSSTVVLGVHFGLGS
jgi:hypothetical protein